MPKGQLRLKPSLAKDSSNDEDFYIIINKIIDFFRRNFATVFILKFIFEFITRTYTRTYTEGRKYQWDFRASDICDRNLIFLQTNFY